MNTYETIKIWLEKTQRNEYFFRSEEFIPKHRLLSEEYYAAYQVLSKALDRPMTREEYLDWRKAWRATYSKISAEIRWAKNGRKTSRFPEDLAIRNASTAITLGIRAEQLMCLRMRSKDNAREAYSLEQGALEAA